jgi:hypothetical protein
LPNVAGIATTLPQSGRISDGPRDDTASDRRIILTTEIVVAALGRSLAQLER